VLDAALHAHGIQVLADLAPNAPAFDFELLEADWDAGSFLGTVADRLLAVPRAGLPTWVLSSQDAAPRRARAAALLMLALPGSAFLYQGEELGPGLVGDLASGIRAQEHDPGSVLNLYRQALAWRRKLQAGPSLEWMPGTGGQVLHLRRPGGWRSVTNVGPHPVPLPPGTIVAASSPLAGVGPDSAMLPAEATAWVLTG
jgi:alpha-glucosidase